MNTLDHPGEAGEATPVESLDQDQLRPLIRMLTEELAGWRAKLSLLLNAAVQYELDRAGGNDGLDVIASVASMRPAALSRLLAGDYRPTPKVWDQIERILMLCQASRGVERVTAARLYFGRIVELHGEKSRLLNRGVELTRRTTEAGRGAPVGKARSVAGQEGSNSSNKPTTVDVAENKSAAAKTEPSTAEEDAAAEPLPTPAAIPDLRGYEQRPDPLLAKTPAKFVDAMRAYNAWAGKLSYREMERRCEKQISHSTFRNMLTTDVLPKLASLGIFVRVLGGSPEDVQTWATAWRQITMGDFGMIGRERKKQKAMDEGEPPRLESASSRSPGH
jgi:hypothetical protein